MIDITDLSLMDVITEELDDRPGSKAVHFPATGISFHRPEIIARGDDMSLVVVLNGYIGPSAEFGSRMFTGPVTPLSEIHDVIFQQERDGGQWVETPYGTFDGGWKPGATIWRGTQYTRLSPDNTIAVVTDEGLILTEPTRPFRVRHWSEHLVHTQPR